MALFLNKVKYKNWFLNSSPTDKDNITKHS